MHAAVPAVAALGWAPPLSCVLNGETRGITLTPVILHIGTHKTGSTYLQQWLVRNRDSLALDGFNTVRNLTHAHRAAVESIEVKFPAHRLAPEFLKHDLAPILLDLKSQEITNKPVAVVSSEYYWNADPKRILDFYESHGMRIIKVICFVRRQDRLLASGYNQSVKALGKSDTFSFSSYSPAFDWSGILERWRQAAPKAEISLRGYDLHRRKGTLLRHGLLGRRDQPAP